MDIRNLYRQVIMDHYKNPQYKGIINDDTYIKVHLNNPTCGDIVTVWLLIEDGIIRDLRHDGIGCSICCSSASMASVMLINKPIKDALVIINEFYTMIKGEPIGKNILDGEVLAYQNIHNYPARIKCATLAWKAYEKGIVEGRNEK